MRPTLIRESGFGPKLEALDEDTYARLSEGWESLWRQLPNLDLTDETQWGEPIDDPDEYFRAVFRV